MSRENYTSPEEGFRRSLGARIEKALRGRPQKWLAERLGLRRPASVSDWIRGEAMPMADTLLRISEILGCEPGWLLAGDDPLRVSNIEADPFLAACERILDSGNDQIVQGFVVNIYAVLDQVEGAQKEAARLREIAEDYIRQRKKRARGVG